MKRFWIFLACAFALTALIMFLRTDYEKAFIAAALGAVSWMLSYRVQMREKVRANEPSENLDDSLETDEEE
ncbi:MAG TPA: hypothetical protein VJ372_25715 [Pyrinomonadaceae bacterium]|nr:hypothetical protein [Pyrinomonadaceae bacterium]